MFLKFVLVGHFCIASICSAFVGINSRKHVRYSFLEVKVPRRQWRINGRNSPADNNSKEISIGSSYKSNLPHILKLLSVSSLVFQSQIARSANGINVKGLFDVCPANENCVSSQDDRPAYFQAPWCYDGEFTTVKRKLIDFILTIPDSRIVKSVDSFAENDRYFSAEFASESLYGSTIVDEIQFYFTPNDNTIQFRSLRRERLNNYPISLPDFGANRERLENIRIALNLETVPVLRNRRRVLFFIESPFDSFGPPTIQFEEMIDAISGDMAARAAKGGVLGELDPVRPVWETTIWGG